MKPLVERAAALEVIIITAGLAAGMVAAPLVSTHIDQELELKITRERHASLVARRKDPALIKRQLETPVTEMTDAGLVAAASDEEIARVAEEQIRSILERQQAALTSWTALPGSEVHGVRAFRVEFAFLSSAARVLPVLSSIEEGLPALFFDRIAIRRQETGFVPTGSKTGEMVEISGAVRLLFLAPESMMKARI
jgi:hypothetical protein